MPVGLSYAGTYPLEDFLEVARAGDEAGLDSIWLAEEFVYRIIRTMRLAVDIFGTRHD